MEPIFCVYRLFVCSVGVGKVEVATVVGVQHNFPVSSIYKVGPPNPLHRRTRRENHIAYCRSAEL